MHVVGSRAGRTTSILETLLPVLRCRRHSCPNLNHPVGNNVRMLKSCPLASGATGGPMTRGELETKRIGTEVIRQVPGETL